VHAQRRLLSVRPCASPLPAACAGALEELLRSDATDVDGASLELSHCGLQAHVLRDILKAVTTSGVACRKLELASNHLGDDAAEAVAHFLWQQNSAVEEIDISSNELTSWGLLSLCVALAGHPANVYPLVEEAIGVCAPCRLDLRSNSICKPAEMLELLRGHGVVTCLGARCSQRRCRVGAPVHIAGGLARQEHVVQHDTGELLALLGPTIVKKLVVRRRALGGNSFPPPPGRGEWVVPKRTSTYQPCRPPQSVPVAKDTLKSNAAPPLELQENSPLGPGLSCPKFTAGQLVQARCDTCGDLQQHPGFKASEMLKVLCAPELALHCTGQIQVFGAAEGRGSPYPAWVHARDVLAEPLLQ